MPVFFCLHVQVFMPAFCLQVKAFFSSFHARVLSSRRSFVFISSCQLIFFGLQLSSCQCFFPSSHQSFVSTSSCQCFVFMSKLCFHASVVFISSCQCFVFMPVFCLQIDILSSPLFFSFCVFGSKLCFSCQHFVSTSKAWSSCQHLVFTSKVFFIPVFCLQIKASFSSQHFVFISQSFVFMPTFWSETSKLFFKPVFCLHVNVLCRFKAAFCLHVKALSLLVQGSVLSSCQSFVFVGSRQCFVFMSKLCLCRFKATFCLHVKALPLSVQGSVLSSWQNFAIMSNAFFPRKSFNVKSSVFTSHQLSSLATLTSTLSSRHVVFLHTALSTHYTCFHIAVFDFTP